MDSSFGWSCAGAGSELSKSNCFVPSLCDDKECSGRGWNVCIARDGVILFPSHCIKVDWELRFCCAAINLDRDGAS